MKYAGMPQGMWILFKRSFQKQLTDVFGYDKTTAGSVRKMQRRNTRKLLRVCRNLKRRTALK